MEKFRSVGEGQRTVHSPSIHFSQPAPLGRRSFGAQWSGGRDRQTNPRSARESRKKEGCESGRTMREDLQPTQAEFSAMSPTEQISALCDVHECKDKVRRVHLRQYTQERWNPHPPRRFLHWWNLVGPSDMKYATGRLWEIS